MNFPQDYDDISIPSPDTVRSSTGGLSPSATVGELIKIVQLMEAKLGLGSSTDFTANSSLETYTAIAHGLGDGDVIIVSSTLTLPTGLSPLTRYFVINSTDDTFELSETSGGSAIDISTNGTGVLSFTRLLGVGRALVGGADGVSDYTVEMPDSAVVGVDDPQTLDNKTLVAPTIEDFNNAQHDHIDAEGGGQLGKAALTSVAQESFVPVGTVLAFGGDTEPDGYIFGYGQEESRTDRADLFAVYGTRYGSGDGSTTFNVPDLRDMVVAFRGDMGGMDKALLTTDGGGLDGTVLGAIGGDEVHANPLSDAGAAALTMGVIGSSPDSILMRRVTSPSWDITHSNSSSITFHGQTGPRTAGAALVGNTDDASSVQPTIVMNGIIKT